MKQQNLTPAQLTEWLYTHAKRWTCENIGTGYTACIWIKQPSENSIYPFMSQDDSQLNDLTIYYSTAHDALMACYNKYMNPTHINSVA